jgi:hypothetical protein
MDSLVRLSNPGFFSVKLLRLGKSSQPKFFSQMVANSGMVFSFRGIHQDVNQSARSNLNSANYIAKSKSQPRQQHLAKFILPLFYLMNMNMNMSLNTKMKNLNCMKPK